MSLAAIPPLLITSHTSLSVQILKARNTKHIHSHAPMKAIFFTLRCRDKGLGMTLTKDSLATGVLANRTMLWIFGPPSMGHCLESAI